MKKIFPVFLLCLTASLFTMGNDVFWVGPANGNWNNSNNWSSTAEGKGGYGVPGAEDSVTFTSDAEVNMDASPTLKSLTVIGDLPGTPIVKLYTGTGCVLTILNYLKINGASLIDSTSENVPFNVVLNGATNASGLIGSSGSSWTFVGRVPVSGGGGATFTAEPGSLVTVKGFSRIVSGSNSAYISCQPSSLDFSLQSQFIISNNLDAAIPDATFQQDYVLYANIPIFPPPETLRIPGASIYIDGKIGTIKHLNPQPRYRLVVLSLPEQNTAASLALPDNSSATTVIVTNTNDNPLTLLASSGNTSLVSAALGTLQVTGEHTKVALATATNTAPANSFQIQVNFFEQSGGNFSLQDFDQASGSSTLSVSRDFTQTGGTFLTTSANTNEAGSFVLEMNGGDFFYNKPYGDDSRGQSLSLSSGSIDNGSKKIVLRINTPAPWL